MNSLNAAQAVNCSITVNILHSVSFAKSQHFDSIYIIVITFYLTIFLEGFILYKKMILLLHVCYGNYIHEKYIHEKIQNNEQFVYSGILIFTMTMK